MSRQKAGRGCAGVSASGTLVRGRQQASGASGRPWAGMLHAVAAGLDEWFMPLRTRDPRSDYMQPGNRLRGVRPDDATRQPDVYAGGTLPPGVVPVDSPRLS